MRRFFHKVWPVLVFLAIWALVAHVFRVPTYILPSPERVIAKVFDSRALLGKHAVTSVFEICIGFLAAAVGGFLIGVVIVYSKRLEQAVEPFLVVSQVIPKVALAPLFIIWFGHGLEPKIIIAATIAFFPVLVNTVLGLKSVDREILEMMDSIAASKRQIFWRVRLPNSLPYILPSLKVAALLSVVGAMVGEFVGSDKGLGYLMILGDVNLDTELLFAALAVVTLVGLALYGGVGLVERKVARKYGSSEGQQMVTI
jgi:NitT/TauT family transport system permease protein